MAKAASERGVRIAKTILKKEIPTEQAVKLFVDGKTELMPGFISKKGRKFSAHLTLDKVTGKLGFEFAPRKKAAKKKSPKKSAKESNDVGRLETEDVSVDRAPKKKKSVAKKKPAAKKKTAKKRKIPANDVPDADTSQEKDDLPY